MESREEQVTVQCTTMARFAARVKPTLLVSILATATAPTSPSVRRRSALSSVRAGGIKCDPPEEAEETNLNKRTRSNNRGGESPHGRPPKREAYERVEESLQAALVRGLQRWKETQFPTKQVVWDYKQYDGRTSQRDACTGDVGDNAIRFPSPTPPRITSS
jgi:hypothetical protein